ncbi:MAG: mannanase [Melioribacteraceae bacterium]|nr:mannanase [Melioribacteraceae bacterium]
MIKRILFLIPVILILQSCTGLITKEKQSNFIRVDNGRFMLDGCPYFFSGTNFWHGCYLGSPGETGDRERLKRELDFLLSIGVTNLRVLAASEESDIKNSLKPAIQKKPGDYDEGLLEGLDYLLSEMGKRKMHAVIFLNNYWEWSGGMAQYNSWFGDREIPDPSDPQSSWNDFMNYSASFYRNKEANEYFRQFIAVIVTRVNKFTGVYYYEDPTIMAWQLANEPRPGNGEPADKYIDYYYAWIESTARFLHSIDPNHLVTTGNEGLMGSNGSEEYYIKAHETQYIDYITFHLWAKNWGWFDGSRIEETFPQTVNNAIEYLNKHIEYARLLKKPITLEEFGMPRDGELFLTGSPTTARDKYYSAVFTLLSDSAAAGAPVGGWNFWTWGGEGKALHDDGKWRKGDPFTGDPPQEAQGLNSVFESDESTIKVIKYFSDKMNSLRKIKLASETIAQQNE